MTDGVLAQLGAIRTMDIGTLKTRWRELFSTEPPPYNRKFLESRLGYRVQELAFGGLKPETVKRLAALADEIDRGRGRKGADTNDDRPIAGTRLIRGWQGVEHCVTVRPDGYEYEGQIYRSLSAVARRITGTRWNGWLFFGLRNQKRAAR